MINSLVDGGKVVGGNKVFTLLLISMPLLNIYGLFSESFAIGDTLMVVITPYLFLNLLKSRKKSKSTTYWFFYVYLIISSIIVIALENDSFSKTILLSISKDIFYVVIFAYLSIIYFNTNFGFSIYKKISIALSMVVFIQYILYIFIGKTSPWVINNSTVIFRSVGGIDRYLYTIGQDIIIRGYKPSAFFSEPAKLVQYLSPCLVLILFQRNIKSSDFRLSHIITFAIILSSSANGIAYLILIWGVWLLKNVYSEQKINSKILFLCILLLGGIVGIFVFIPEKVSIFSRFSEIGADSITSGNMRVLRGWYVFGMLNTFNKIFGVGLDNITTYIRKHGITTTYDAGYIGYMSGLSTIFVIGGVIGGLLFVYIIVKYYKASQKTGRCMILLLLLILVASSLFHSEVYAICMVYIIKLSLEDKHVSSFG